MWYRIQISWTNALIVLHETFLWALAALSYHVAAVEIAEFGFSAKATDYIRYVYQCINELNATQCWRNSSISCYVIWAHTISIDCLKRQKTLICRNAPNWCGKSKQSDCNSDIVCDFERETNAIAFDVLLISNDRQSDTDTKKRQKATKSKHKHVHMLQRNGRQSNKEHCIRLIQFTIHSHHLLG